MKTKFVTMFYGYHGGPPYWGHWNRDHWYQSSLVSICGLNHEIVCYTDEGDKGENQLRALKERHGLTNLIIKTFNMLENPYQERIYNIRMNNPNVYNNPELGHFYNGSPQIYWSKFDFLLKEYEPDINLYWIDGGLSHPGLFPLNGRKYEHYEDYKHYWYPDYFNASTVERINKFSENKIINLYQYNITNQNLREFNEVIGSDSMYEGVYVKGGFFGGNSNLMLDYLNELKKVIEVVLSKNNFLCMDEQIMIYVNYHHRDWFKNWRFETWYFDDPNQIGFHQFFNNSVNKN